MIAFEGSGVILTGASGGIGSALAGEFLRRGAEVLAVGRRRAALDALQARSTGPGRLSTLVADITNRDDRRRICDRASTLSRPTLLVHAAALGQFTLFARGSEAASQRLFDTNVLAPIALTRSILPMLVANPAARVVAIGSTFGSIAFPGFAEYSASKFALRGLFEALAREYADRPVRFQWLAPRATRTAFNDAATEAFNAASGTAVDTPEDVASALVAAIRNGRLRQQLGWPEKLVIRVNGAFPGLLDRVLRGSLPLVRRYANPISAPNARGELP